jgi:hypothetical protein
VRIRLEEGKIMDKLLKLKTDTETKIDKLISQKSRDVDFIKSLENLLYIVDLEIRKLKQNLCATRQTQEFDIMAIRGWRNKLGGESNGA